MRHRITRLALALALALAAPVALGLTPGAAAQAPRCTADTGPYQREVERGLHLGVDGRQSGADCAAVRRFQQAHGVRPADGYAGLATYRIMLAVQAGSTPNRAGRCPSTPYRTVCVDLTRQLLWVQQRRRILYAPVPVRTGRDGQETRGGAHRIFRRVRDDHSRLYANAPMPYAQYFDGGQALHGTPHDLFNGAGSAGCVNLRLPDAARLWRTVGNGDRVFVWGARPGTR